MSLINDALKRAKAAQQPAAPVTGPQLRPAEPSQQARHGLGLALPVALAAIALFGLFLLWQLAQKNPPAQPAAGPLSAPATVAAAPAVPLATASPPAVEPGGKSVPNQAAVPDSKPPESAAIVPAPASPATNALAAAPPPPRPAPLKLQAIVYNPSRPSAMINGKTLFVGDRIGEFRVSAITAETATLYGPGKTNLLSLPSAE